ncbi:MAG: nitrilase [Gammaproteobacteria bacterium]|nr:nitrilase [Gammaproteobacteria bacterium]
MNGSGNDKAVAPYAALALQMRCHAVNDCRTVDEARARIRASIERCDGLIRGSRQFIKTYSGDDTRLVVLPEYFLTGYPRGEDPAEWRARACLRPNGPEYELLGESARGNGVWLSGNAYETDDNFPDLHFQCSFIIDPSGELILRYRRQISMFAPTPHDVLERYLEICGEDALYPVADTEIGRLACVASEEILFPEISSELARRGAEVICHSSSEQGSLQLTPKNIAKRARAFENQVYVVSANSAGIAGPGFPEDSTDGHSQVVDFKGRLLAEAAFGESMCAFAELDVEALRRERAKTAMLNVPARRGVLDRDQN